MKPFSLFLALLMTAMTASLPATSAFADSPGGRRPPLSVGTEGPDEDLSLALVEVLSTVADVLAVYQDQTANEAYLGSAAARNRLQTAISRVPQIFLPQGAARPFLEGWFFDDDDE